MGRLSENSVVSIKNKSHAVTAEVVVPESGAEGVIIAQGGSVGGWSFYAHEGKLKYCYNFLGLQHFYTEASTPIPSGTRQVRMEFAYDRGGLAKGGGVTLHIDGRPVGGGRVERTVPMVFSVDETTAVGRESGSPTSPDYRTGSNAFSCEVNWVQVDLGQDSHDHLISPDERSHVAIARH